MLGEQASYTCLPAAWGANWGKTSGQEKAVETELSD